MKILIAVLMMILTSCAHAEILPSTKQPDPPKSNTMKITIGSTIFTATLATSTSVTAFKEMLPLTLLMSDFNSNEKVAELLSRLTTTAINPDIIQTGDIMLYGSNSLVLFYETFSTSYSYTRIGRIDSTAGLKVALGKGDVTIKFELNGD